jgi:hypothetical protein
MAIWYFGMPPLGRSDLPTANVVVYLVGVSALLRAPRHVAVFRRDPAAVSLVV